MMSEPAPPGAGLHRLMSRLTEIGAGEVRVVALSFATFFAVLCSYYIIRPIRDEMGVTVGPDGLKQLFFIVLLVMLAAVPLFGWVVASFAKRRVLPIVYVFFVLNLVVFWALLGSGHKGPWVAGAFFVWVSVFVLFVVSLFWSLMSDLYRSEQAKRLYGLVAAGGSAGAFTGPLITQSLVHAVGTANLLLVSAFVLALALAAAQALARAVAGEPGRLEESERRSSEGILSGAINVWRSPYLMNIALWVLLANLISTFFYFEQARIVGAAIPERADRVQLFARMDFVSNTLTILMQLFLTARVIKHGGLGIAAAALPVSAALGLLTFAIAPVLGVVAVVMVVERAITFALANPAMRVLYTVVPPDDKYKAQNFIDTVVFRGGDAASGWVFDGLSKGLGLGTAAVALATIPFALGWAALSFALGRQQAERAERTAKLVATR